MAFYTNTRFICFTFYFGKLLICRVWDEQQHLFHLRKLVLVINCFVSLWVRKFNFLDKQEMSRVVHTLLLFRLCVCIYVVYLWYVRSFNFKNTISHMLKSSSVLFCTNKLCTNFGINFTLEVRKSPHKGYEQLWCQNAEITTQENTHMYV